MCTFRTGEACTCTAAISSGPRTRRQSRRRLCIPSTAPTPRRSSDKTKRETRRTVQTRPASALCFNTHTRSHTHTHVFIAESVHTHVQSLTYSYTTCNKCGCVGHRIVQDGTRTLRANTSGTAEPPNIALESAAGASGWRQRPAPTVVNASSDHSRKLAYSCTQKRMQDLQCRAAH